MAVPRFVVVDENICARGGHYLELATVILREAAVRGYEARLWTSDSFSPESSHDCPWHVRPTFGRTKMRRWSLGVDGHSRWRRGVDGQVVGAPQPLRSLVRLWEAVSPNPPATMLKAWCEDFRRALGELAPQPDDRILLSTADDFTLLALATALTPLRSMPPLQLDLLFHLSLLPGRPGQPGGQRISRQFALQTIASIEHLQPHQVRLWATTEELAEQLNAACGRALWKAIDYPIRPEFHRAGRGRERTGLQRRRMLLGGGVRTEKGKHSIAATVDALWPEFLSGDWQLAMQLPKNAKAQRLVPSHLRQHLAEFRVAGRHAPLRVADGVLSDAAYARWIASADAGLFLYDGQRYFARCSGVLVEMLSAGVPVIVPAASWLSRQLSPRIYEHLDELARTAHSATDSQRIVHGQQSLTVHWQPQHQGLLIAFDQPRSAGDCIAIIAEPLDVQGRERGTADRWILDERPAGPMRVLIKRPPGASATRITYRPAFPYGAAVPRPHTGRLMGAEAPPESAVGLIAAGPDQLPRLIRELQTHQGHYAQTAAAHADAWTSKHSAAAMFDALHVPAVRAAVAGAA